MIIALNAQTQDPPTMWKKLQIIDMSDPDDKPIIDCSNPGKKCGVTPPVE